MKILYFDDFKLGVLKGNDVVDVSDAVKDIPHTGPHDLISGLIALVSGAPAGMVNVGLGIVVLFGLFKSDTTEWLMPSPF